MTDSQLFSSSATRLDLSRVTLIGRLGADPILRKVSYFSRRDG